MNSLYVVATGQRVGKTTLSLGLIKVLESAGLRVGFFKPVGQQYVERDGERIDKDVVLIQSAFSVRGAASQMSPVTVPRGFVESYIFNRDVEPLKRQIFEAYERLAEHCDVLLVEGTGHAGVGSCLDLSNADVAAMLNARAVLIVEGGIGSALDEAALNISLFRARNVDVVGVIANKVFPEKRDRIEKSLRQGFANMDLKLLGAVPYDRSLTYPRVGQVADTLSAQVLCGEQALNTRIENVLVAAMEPQNVLPRIGPRSLMITPGDRIDNILMSLSSGLFRGDTHSSVVGLVLTDRKSVV